MALEPEIIIPNFTKEDYLTGTKPFEWLYEFEGNPLKFNQLSALLKEKASGVGVKNFGTLLKSYTQLIKAQRGIFNENVTNFTDQPFELNCGKWVADDFGISGNDRNGLLVKACSHPIMPVGRLVNIDTGIEKLKLIFSKGKMWRELVVEKNILANKTKIVELANYGIGVNSENAKYLVSYLSEAEELNYDKIEEINAVSRLGWIDDYGFSPYVENLKFDGDLSYKHFFNAVSENGKYENWLSLAKEVRKNSIYARIMLAASFASVIVKVCGALPFFVHLWGGTETGKTVGLMLASSVWANPKMGAYIHTFNGTKVAQELAASFVNSMPLIIDELQIIKDKKDFDEIIYMLSEGVGKSRGKQSGGLQNVGTWQNCIITTGEMPITSNKSGAGAINRIIEIDCKNVKVFSNPAHVADVIKQNYGFAGKKFVEKLQDADNADKVRTIQKEFYKMFSDKDTTEKQALAASILLTADVFANEWIFKDGSVLQIENIEPFLSTKKEVSANERALSYIYDFVAINSNKFFTSFEYDIQGEVWGAQDDNYIYIIKAQFDKIMNDEGFSAAAFLSWAKERNLIETDNGKNTKTKRICKTVTRCVWLKKPKYEEDAAEEDTSIPY